MSTKQISAALLAAATLIAAPALAQTLTAIPPISGPGNLKVWSSCDQADMNGDNVIDFFDIDPFLLMLFDPAGFAEQYPNVNPLNADRNGDDVVDFFDIDPFLACLFGACP